MPHIDFNNILTWPADWLGFISLAEVERLTSLSEDSIRRHYADKIVHLSTRRVAMRKGHALGLGMRAATAASDSAA